MSRSLALVSLAALGFSVPAPASAHIGMLSPAPRSSDQKAGPCGRAGSSRGSNVTVFAPGQTITVTWDEQIDHPGHYRISFDADGEDAFVDPASPDERNTNDAVLLDGIADRSGGGEYSAEVTLPSVECERCTLQLIQVMTDKPPYAPGTNDIYYQCADVALRTGGGGTDPSSDGGCRCVQAATPIGAWWLWAIGLLLARRLRARGSAEAR